MVRIYPILVLCIENTQTSLLAGKKFFMCDAAPQWRSFKKNIRGKAARFEVLGIPRGRGRLAVLGSITRSKQTGLRNNMLMRAARRTRFLAQQTEGQWAALLRKRR